jgi:hypothetical protein
MVFASVIVVGLPDYLVIHFDQDVLFGKKVLARVQEDKNVFDYRDFISFKLPIKSVIKSFG